MRICVLGNSTSFGTGLTHQSLAWPWLVAGRLSQELGGDVGVRHVMLMPIGARVADYAAARVREHDPDIVIVLIGSYACAVRTVGERVRRRYGERAARGYRTLERAFESRTGNRPGRRGRLNTAGRWLARHLIGTAAMTSVDEVVRAYSDVLRRLAQPEGAEVVVFPEPIWTTVAERENPGANRIFAEVRRRVRAVAEEHRLHWVDPEPVFAAAPDRQALYLSDGAHKTAEGHRMQAAVITEALENVAAVRAAIEAAPGR